jgi:hypothetical protein
MLAFLGGWLFPGLFWLEWWRLKRICDVVCAEDGIALRLTGDGGRIRYGLGEKASPYMYTINKHIVANNPTALPERPVMFTLSPMARQWPWPSLLVCWLLWPRSIDIWQNLIYLINDASLHKENGEMMGLDTPWTDFVEIFSNDYWKCCLGEEYYLCEWTRYSWPGEVNDDSLQSGTWRTCSGHWPSRHGP